MTDVSREHVRDVIDEIGPAKKDRICRTVARSLDVDIRCRCCGRETEEFSELSSDVSHHMRKLWNRNIIHPNAAWEYQVNDR